jgi:hypothetical protein
MLPQATASRKKVVEAYRLNEDDRIKHVCQ